MYEMGNLELNLCANLFLTFPPLQQPNDPDVLYRLAKACHCLYDINRRDGNKEASETYILKGKTWLILCRNKGNFITISSVQNHDF